MKVTGTITKDYILNNISQSLIFSTYISKFLNFNITTEEIEYLAANPSKNIISPLRNDIVPSVGFMYKNIRGKNKLKMRDFGGYFWGDCFDLVGYLIKKDSNSPIHFNEILNHIYLMLNGNVEVIPITNLDIIKTRSVIKIEIRKWNNSDRM